MGMQMDIVLFLVLGTFTHAQEQLWEEKAAFLENHGRQERLITSSSGMYKWFMSLDDMPKGILIGLAMTTVAILSGFFIIATMLYLTDVTGNSPKIDEKKAFSKKGETEELSGVVTNPVDGDTTGATEGLTEVARKLRSHAAAERADASAPKAS
ncbi:AaceriADR418Cp [[Ashbya] aceris (nom. inval.)]|nr:AaceriADR418Cp [[Ashbya] aceris (nom. inval.)]